MPAVTFVAETGTEMTRPSTAARVFSGIAEAQQGRTFLWCAPALAAGAGLYFAAPAEPSVVLAAGIGGLGLLLIWFGRTAPLVLLAGVVAAGFVLAKLQVEQSAGPLIARTARDVRVTGRLLSLERTSPGRQVMVVAPDVIAGFEAAGTPRRLRLSMAGRAGHLRPGQRVSFTASLAPLPTPVAPGGFDYGRSLWLDGVGGTGRVTSAVETLPGAIAATDGLARALAGLRAAMGARIHAVLPEPQASFAEALITGERSTIPPQINRSLLVSGLYHILSISGLHMWLVAGGVFWAVRAGLALVPALALRVPIRKWAAGAALAVALFYDLLADGGVATARSFIMVAIVFFAIMVDRPALSMRNLALAAVLILLVDPAAAIEASFQMSFLAVLGLVAFHEAWSGYRAGRAAAQAGATPRHWARRLAAWILTAAAADLVTSAVAGFSSSLPAAYHFGRVAPYGILANGLAVPVEALLIMPFALLSAVLMPLGLEWLPLHVMGRGLTLLVAISDGVAALPGADQVIARPPAPAVLLAVAGLMLLCLLRGSVRLAGVAVMAAGGLFLLAPPPAPDLLVEAAGRNVVLRDGAGRLVPALPRRARFAVERWLVANGEEASLAEAASRPGWTCGQGRCTAIVRGRRVLFVSGGEGRPLDCAGADVLIADFPLRGACRAVPLRIDRFDLWRRGAHAVQLGDGAPLVATARGEQGKRPWVVTPAPRRPLDGTYLWAHEAAP